MNRLYIACCVGLLCWISNPNKACAGELEEFQKARDAFENQDYANAATLFRSLAEDDMVQRQSRPLWLESKKYLAVSELFLGHKAQAESQFETLIQQEPNYELDPLAFPTEVQELFSRVRAKWQFQQERTKLAQEEATRIAKAKAEAEAVAARERQMRLIELAQTRDVEHVNSRWIAAIPFGVGQFQNRHRSLGTALAVSEGVLLATSVVSYFFHDALKNDQPSVSQLDEANRAEQAFRVINWVSISAFAAVAIAGIIDAQVRFVPAIRETQRRPLPEDLKQLYPENRLSRGTSFTLQW